jgi:TrpR-related protein YerC/YecD
MAKRSFTEGTWRADPWFRNLCRALASCRNAEEIANFLRDVGTLSELKAWSERFEVAKQIAGGKTYREITEKTGASTTTVTRVGSYLFDGEGGYTRALTSLTHHPLSSRPR